VRESRRIKMSVQMARLASIKTLAGFDFAVQPCVVFRFAFDEVSVGADRERAAPVFVAKDGTRIPLLARRRRREVPGLRHPVGSRRQLSCLAQSHGRRSEGTDRRRDPLFWRGSSLSSKDVSTPERRNSATFSIQIKFIFLTRRRSAGATRQGCWILGPVAGKLHDLIFETLTSLIVNI
jgi:hypothetical protein